MPEQTTAGGPQLYTAEIDWETPPLTANQRLHWSKKAKITKRVRRRGRTEAENLAIPALAHAEVHLAWHVSDRIRRDVDNVVPTLKALCDGLVDALVVPDDTPDLMTKLMPQIVYIPAHVEDRTPHMVLTVLGARRAAPAPALLVEFERKTSASLRLHALDITDAIAEAFRVTGDQYLEWLVAAARTHEGLATDAITANRVIERDDATRRREGVRHGEALEG